MMFIPGVNIVFAIWMTNMLSKSSAGLRYSCSMI
jgi:hypothetical protein